MPRINASASGVSDWDQVSKLETELASIMEKVYYGQNVDNVTEGTVPAIQQALQQTASGQGVNLSAALSVNAVNAPADAPQIEAALGTEYKVLQYLDVHIDVRLNDTTVGGITRIGQPINFSVTLPAGADSQLVFVIRYHDGAVTSLPTTVENGMLHFTSDRFSTYAVVSAPKRTDYVTVDNIPVQVYGGVPVTPAVKVAVNGTALTEGVDYTVTYANNLGPGTATAYISGMNGYVGISASKDFVIVAPSPSPVPSPTPDPAAPVPPTGDGTPLALYAALPALCAAALAVLLAGRRRKQP